MFDALLVGGGPAGLSAALALGRARRRVLICDAGTPRNAAATHVHTFLTRDGTPPAEMRRVGREQLAQYPTVEYRASAVRSITGAIDAFEVQLGDGVVQARRLILCTGMIDELPSIEGFREHWGTAIFQCPYCHGWEVQDRRFGFLASAPERLDFALLLRNWSRDVTVFTNGAFDVPPDVEARFARANLPIERRAIAALVGDGRLTEIALADRSRVAIDVLFAHPRQRQVPIVESLGLALDPHGFVRLHEMHRETSRPGIYAAGDLTTGQQAAILAAASGMQAAAMLNHALSVA